jgi:hypothetical protein
MFSYRGQPHSFKCCNMYKFSGSHDECCSNDDHLLGLYTMHYKIFNLFQCFRGTYRLHLGGNWFWLRWMLKWLGGRKYIAYTARFDGILPNQKYEGGRGVKACTKLMRVESSKVSCRPSSCTQLCRKQQQTLTQSHFLYVKWPFVPKDANDYATMSPIQSIHTGITAFYCVTWQKYDPTVDHCFVNTSDGFALCCEPWFPSLH